LEDGREMTMEELQKKSKEGQIGKGGKALKWALLFNSKV
jgi:hypothetical protein